MEVPGKKKDKSSDVLCDLCLLLGKNMKAEHFCADCNEFFCDNCCMVHKVTRYSRNHKLLDSRNMPKQKLESYENSVCSKHNGKGFEYICEDHNSIFCSVCVILDHKNCSLLCIDDIATDFDKTPQYKSLIDSIASLTKQLQEMKDKSIKKGEKLQKSHGKFLRDVKAFRKEINQILDTIEGTIIKEADDLKEDHLKSAVSDTAMCDNIIDELNIASEKMREQLRYMQHRQLVISAKETQIKCKEYDAKLVEMAQGESMELEFVRNENLLQSLRSFTTMGDIKKMGNSKSVYVMEDSTISAGSRVSEENEADQLGSAEFTEFMQATQEAKEVLRKCLGLVQRLEPATTGITLNTDSQYNLVQGFFARSSTRPSTEKAEQSPKKDAELGPDDLNRYEVASLDSLQNGILHQASEIQYVVDDLLSTLKKVVPVRLWQDLYRERGPLKQVDVKVDNAEHDKHDTALKNGETEYNAMEKQVDVKKNEEVSSDSSSNPSLQNEMQKRHDEHRAEIERMNEELLDKNRELNNELVSKEQQIEALVGKVSGLKTTLSDKNQLYEHLQKQYDDKTGQLENEIKAINNDVKAKQKEIQELNDKKDEIDNVVDSQPSEHENEKKELNDEINSLRNEINEIKQKNEDLVQNLDEQKQYIEGFENRESRLKSEKHEIDEHLRLNENKYETLVKENDANKDLIDAKKNEIEALKKEIRDHLAKKDQKENVISKLERKIQDLETEIKRLQSRIKTLEREGRDQENRLRNASEKLSSKRKQLMEMERNLSQLTRERDRYKAIHDAAEAEAERQRLRKRVAALLYIPRRGDLLNTIVGELNAKLVSSFGDTHDVTLTEVDNASQIVPNTPVLVVCINASRLGTDVSNALNGVRANPNVAVIVLHHKESHALPNQSSERVLTSVEYKSLGGIFDMACLSSRGLYACEMNTNAIAGLVNFIKQRN